LIETGTAKLLAEVRRGAGVAFSFNRGDSDAARGRSDLKAVIELLRTKREIAAGLASARQRAIEGDAHAPAEMLRLEHAIHDTNRKLADLYASD
jgi:hypothetical protein